MKNVQLDWRPAGQPFTIDNTSYELFQDIILLCKMLDLKLQARGDKSVTTSGNSEFTVEAGVYSWEIIYFEKKSESMQVVIDFIYDKNCHIYGIDVGEYVNFEEGFVNHKGKSNQQKLQRIIDRIKGVE